MKNIFIILAFLFISYSLFSQGGEINSKSDYEIFIEKMKELASEFDKATKPKDIDDIILENIVKEENNNHKQIIAIRDFINNIKLKLITQITFYTNQEFTNTIIELIDKKCNEFDILYSYDKKTMSSKLSRLNFEKTYAKVSKLDENLREQAKAELYPPQQDDDSAEIIAEVNRRENEAKKAWGEELEGIFSQINASGYGDFLDTQSKHKKWLEYYNQKEYAKYLKSLCVVEKSMELTDSVEKLEKIGDNLSLQVLQSMAEAHRNQIKQPRDEKWALKEIISKSKLEKYYYVKELNKEYGVSHEAIQKKYNEEKENKKENKKINNAKKVIEDNFKAEKALLLVICNSIIETLEKAYESKNSPTPAVKEK